jgi:hypothetical protein
MVDLNQKALGQLGRGQAGDVALVLAAVQADSGSSVVPQLTRQQAAVVAGVVEDTPVVGMPGVPTSNMVSPQDQVEVAAVLGAIFEDEEKARVRSATQAHLPFGGMKTMSVEEAAKADEASVIGGDFGRWGPATSAAGKAGASLASAISKKTGKPYKFEPNGNPQSDEGGTVLWFGIEPKDSKESRYFLGVQIKGKDKDNPTWTVKLKRGMGIASSTSVAVVGGLKSDQIAAGIRQAANKL